MATLGEAFIAIRADLRPFTNELEKETKHAADKIEKDLSKAVSDGIKKGAKDAGRKLGDDVSDGFSDRFKKKTGDKKQPPWISITSALAGALDDGISALPSQVKAAIVLGIVAALPIIGAFITGALAGAIALGVAGIGVALASQYTSVKEEATRVFENIRVIGIKSAAAFEQSTLQALDIIEQGFIDLSPKIKDIFDQTANLAPILSKGLVGALGEIVDSVDKISGDLGPFAVELARGFVTLGDAIGETLEILINTGADGRVALRDLFNTLADILTITADTLAFLTKVYNTARDGVMILEAVFSGGSTVDIVTQKVNDLSLETDNLTTANQQLADGGQAVIAMTKAEQKEFKDLTKAVQGLNDAVYSSIQANVDFERSLDDLNESLDKNGKTLDINKEQGRENVEAFLKALQDAGKAAQDRVATGELTQEQAAHLYDEEIARVQKLAKEGGITAAQFDNLFGKAIQLSELEINPDPAGILALKDSTLELSDALRQALERSAAIARFRLPAQGTRIFSEYADGDIITKPTLGLVGEAGPEVIVPLTKPARAAQLLRQSGLSSMLGGSNAANVAVYIGNEQLDARMYRIAQDNTKANSLALAYGPR